MLRKIISGGQTGADQGGLLAGEALGLKTGGTAPPKFMTENGPMPNYLKQFGLIEGEKDPSTFKKRTIKNIEDSDGTVIFMEIPSPGSQMTIIECKKRNKPSLLNPTSEQLRVWTEKIGIKILNVAGNRRSKAPRLEMYTFGIIFWAFYIRRDLKVEDDQN